MLYSRYLKNPKMETPCISQNVGSKTKKMKFPFFIISFVLLSMVPIIDILPKSYIEIISRVSHYTLITAMAGIGLNIAFDSILQDEESALFLGSGIFLVQFSLVQDFYGFCSSKKARVSFH